MGVIRTLACWLMVFGAATTACNSTPDVAQPASAAAWQIDSAKSTLHFVTTKAGQPGAGDVGEVQSTSQFAGGMTSVGSISFTVTLASVATGVDIRDERLRTMLFNVEDTPLGVVRRADRPGRTARSRPRRRERHRRRRSVDARRPEQTAGRETARGAAGRVAVVGRHALADRGRCVQFGLKGGVGALRDIMSLNFLATSAPLSLQSVLGEKS